MTLPFRSPAIPATSRKRDEWGRWEETFSSGDRGILDPRRTLLPAKAALGTLAECCDLREIDN